MNELIINNKEYNNSRMLKDPCLKVAKDLDYIKYLEVTLNKINTSLINNNKYSELLLKDNEIFIEYLKYQTLLNNFKSYSKNELLENSKEVNDVENFMKNDITYLYESFLTEEEIKNSNERVSKLSHFPMETIREYIVEQYDSSFDKLSIIDAYVIIKLCDKYISDINKLNNNRLNKQLKLNKNLREMYDLYN